MIARALFLAGFTVSVFTAGCQKGKIESYRIPKEKDPEMPIANSGPATANQDSAPSGGSMATTAVLTAEGAELTWSAPAEWKPKQASAMRKGSYTVPGNGGADGDLSITAFPGDVGGELANVNRWRGQVQLPPVAQADLASVVQRVAGNGLEFGVVDAAGTGASAQRILGAFVPYNGATWFFKLTGPDAVVEHAKPAFLAFLHTVKPASAQ